jgi:hypothetical protein
MLPALRFLPLEGIIHISMVDMDYQSKLVGIDRNKALIVRLLKIVGRKILSDGADFNWQSRFGYAFHSRRIDEVWHVLRTFGLSTLATSRIKKD